MSAPSPVAVRVAELAAARGDDLAVLVDGGDDLTFADWERRSSTVAGQLADRGVAEGDRVALRFDAGRWASYAVAYVGVQKVGGVAVPIPSGLADPDAARILRHSGSAVLLCPAHLDLPTAGRHREEPLSNAVALAEVTYPLAPLSRPRPRCRTASEVLAAALPRLGGCLVHTWAPGSRSGQQALAQLLAGTTAATLASFSPEALDALVARLGASACGLTAGLLDLVVASRPAGTGRSSIGTVLLSARRSVPSGAVAAAFPAATVVELHLDQPEEDDLDQAAPVGASQLGMLWHEQLAPGSFNLPSLVRRYRGRLDVGALAWALAELGRRHEPLRTTFEVTAGLPHQVVGPADPELPVVDLAGLPAAARDAEAARLVADATSRPFDLAEGPLFDPSLLRMGPDDHVLVVRLHHTAFDDWSVDVYRRELSALYAAFVGGQRSPLLDPPARFVDVCRRRQLRLEGPEGEAERASWRRRLAGAPFPVQLPLGDPRKLGPDRPGAGEPLRHDLPPELSRAVRALAPRLRATPFMTVLSAFQLLVARRTGRDDLVVASVVSGRPTTAVEPLLGCFTKKVLLRLRLDGDPPFPELVARTRATVLDALAHQDLPFEEVVHETLGRAAARHGLVAQVPVVFQAETPQQARLVMPGLEVGPFEVPASARRERHHASSRGGAGPPWGDGAYCGTFLLLSLLESPDGLALVARGVFDQAEAQRLLSDLERLLGAVVANPAQRLSELAPPATATATAADDADDLELRGLRLRRSRLEAALSQCPAVADVAVEAVFGDDGDPELTAYVVPRGGAAPTLAELRATLWSVLPGSPWPAVKVVVAGLARRPGGGVDLGPTLRPLPPVEPADPQAETITSLWAHARGREVTPGSIYWQDFSFLQALAEARAAGLPITDEHVSRCRTPEMLAAALTAGAMGVDPRG